jgi:hypothetical protein
MNTAIHPIAPEEVMAWLDGELSEADAQAVTAHVEQCVECARLADEFRAASQSLAQWTVPAVSLNVEEAVLSQASKTAPISLPALPGRSIQLSFWNWRLWAIGSGGAVAAVLIFAVFVPSMMHREDHLKYVQHLASMQQNNEPGYAAQAVSPPVDGQPITDQESKVIADEKKPQEGQSRALSSLVTLTSPGVVADSNGLFHGLGDHVQNSFSIDGQALSAPAPMIARTASLVIVVKDFAASRASLDAIVARHHGYSAQLTVSTPENAPRSFEASLRVPATELSSAIGDIKTLGRVENESQTGEEVTQQHTDLAARLKTSRETEARFEAILVQRTGNVSEVLQVEEGIARVRGDIERMETEQTALEHRVDFATVEIQLSEEFKAQLNAPSASVSNRIHNAFVAGLRSAAATVLGIVLFFEEDGPVVLIWLAILGLPTFLLVRRYRRIRARIQ